MKNFSTKTIIISVIALLLVLYTWSSYNSLTKANIAVDTQWAQVENQLQRQFDLIPNLQATVKGASANEQKIFLGIADARAHYTSAKTTNEKVAAANEYSTGLSRLLAVVEAYPNVQSTQAYRDFSVALEGTQNRITTERGRYNDLVGGFNTMVMIFPKNMMAKLFGFKAHEFFKVEQSAKETPKVDYTN